MCWFKRKMFYVDISEDDINYQHMSELIKLHNAQITMFLSKAVTHVIRTEHSDLLLSTTYQS